MPYLRFQYDALGRRILKEDHTGVSVATTWYTYDGQKVAGEYSPGGSPVLDRYYVDGASYVDEHAVVRQLTGGDAGEYYYLLKELYSVAGAAVRRPRRGRLRARGSSGGGQTGRPARPW